MQLPQPYGIELLLFYLSQRDAKVSKLATPAMVAAWKQQFSPGSRVFPVGGGAGDRTIETTPTPSVV